MEASLRRPPPQRIFLLNCFQREGQAAWLVESAMAGSRAAALPGCCGIVLGVNSDAPATHARQGYADAYVRKFRAGANEYDDLILAKSL